MQLTIVHRGGSRSRWELDPFEDSSALQRRETIHASMTKASFFFPPQPFDTRTTRKASPNEGLAFVDRTGATYFVRTVVISVFRLSLSLRK